MSSDATTPTSRNKRRTLALAAALSIISMSAASEQAVPVQGGQRSAPVTPWVFNGDVRDLPRPRVWKPGDAIRAVPKRSYVEPGGPLPPTASVSGTDPLLERQRQHAARAASGSTLFTQPSRNFDGQGFTGTLPPDTVGDVGPSHYVQAVNSFVALPSSASAQVRIYDKAQPIPNEIATFLMQDLAGGSCPGFSDPLVLHDPQADRWLLAEMSFSNSICVYLSQTGDPVSGGWLLYEFAAPMLPDYPKLGVWATDALGGDGSYTLVTNEGDPSAIYALDRGQMLAGAPATSQRFTVPRLASFGIPAPADTDGANAPPAGAPAIFMRQRDTELNGGPPSPGDVLEMWWLDVDWVDAGNSTLTAAPSIDVAEFDSDLCQIVFACFEQPDGAPALQPLNRFIMHRLQYRNHGSHQSLLGNFTVDVDGTDQGGIRWFELLSTGGGPWTLQQEGTYSIDTDNRWLGAIAGDGAGNIALGLNVVSTVTYPGLRYTGRRSFDSPGVMTQPETVLAPGVASEGTERYGDYTAMSVDPVDDCTFWMAGEYSIVGQWQTRIASFRFENCPCDSVPNAPSVQAVTSGDNRIDVTWSDSVSSTAVEYLVRRSLTAGGPYTSIATVPDSTPGAGGGPGYSFQDTDVSGGVTYYYVVTVLDQSSCPSALPVEAGVTATGDCVLGPTFAGVQGATSGDATCAIELTWSPATAYCGGSVTYDLYRATTPGFVPSGLTLLAAGLPATQATDVNGLIEGVDYYYVVRAIDQANGIDDGNNVYRTTTATGITDGGTQTLLTEEFESPDVLDTVWTVGTGPGPHSCGEWQRSNVSNYQPNGASGYYALTLSEGCPATSTFLDSPVIDMSSPEIQTVQLLTRLRVSVGFGGEAGTLEAWNGAGWDVVQTWSAGSSATGLFFYDVTAQAAGNAQFQLRYNYQNATNAEHFSVDDVSLIAELQLGAECTTGSGIPPVPDGAGATSPLQASRLDAAGTQIDVSFDALACPAPAYNLLHGSLANVSTSTIDGSACGVGAGSFQWNNVPGGDLFYLVVGFNGSDTESRWGDTAPGERNGLTASGECGAILKNISSTCP